MGRSDQSHNSGYILKFPGKALVSRYFVWYRHGLYSIVVLDRSGGIVAAPEASRRSEIATAEALAASKIYGLKRDGLAVILRKL
ncbi:MAG: hypothetical protein EAZ61_01015 [Oscillatoriales cyanobacterium]|nr:MAG: hypothetical protein EAZ61_01015 [Oscillatoriales cyanobacterium]